MKATLGMNIFRIFSPTKWKKRQQQLNELSIGNLIHSWQPLLSFAWKMTQKHTVKKGNKEEMNIYTYLNVFFNCSASSSAGNDAEKYKINYRLGGLKLWNFLSLFNFFFVRKSGKSAGWGFKTTRVVRWKVRNWFWLRLGLLFPKDLSGVNLLMLRCCCCWWWNFRRIRKGDSGSSWDHSLDGREIPGGNLKNGETWQRIISWMKLEI